MDIHPGARLGCGVIIDHGVNVSVSETAVVGDRVYIMHNVVVGGKPGGRHAERRIGDGDEGGGGMGPRIGDDVVLGAYSRIGDVSVGDGARVASFALVDSDVPAGGVAAGIPAESGGGGSWPTR